MNRVYTPKTIEKQPLIPPFCFFVWQPPSARVAMVAVKHELGGATAVRQEAPKALRGGQQQLIGSDQNVLGAGHADAGNVAGAVHVKLDLIEGKAKPWTKDWPGAEGVDERAGAGGGRGGYRAALEVDEAGGGGGIRQRGRP